MARAVWLHPGADADIRHTTDFIRRRVSPRSAGGWWRRIEQVILRLAEDAEQWPEADEAAELGIDLRCRLTGRGRHIYRVLFTYDADTVYVQRVRHAARDRLTADDL